MKYTDLQGAIFDVDETLLNSYPPGEPFGLHEHSRWRAAQIVGQRIGHMGLQNITLAECHDAFTTASAHSLHAATWRTLQMVGLVDSVAELDLDHPLLIDLTTLKDQLHEDTLRAKATEIPGASAFVKLLAHNGLRDRLAIASTACRRDIDIVLDEITDLRGLFPEPTIVSRERFTHPKPHPEPFHTAFATLHLPDDARPYVAAFEDDPRGIASAKQAGLYACAITTRYSRRELQNLSAPPDLIADSYEEFAAQLGLNEALEAQR